MAAATATCRGAANTSRLFDVGANNGAWAAGHLRRHQSTVAYLVEPNPRFVPELQLLVHRYGATHLPSAAWVEDGEVTFHFSKNDESSSLLRERADKLLPGKPRPFHCKPPEALEAQLAYTRQAEGWDGVIRRRDGREAVCDRQRSAQVPAVDLAAFVRRHSCPGDTLTMHLDIEGAEYQVLRRMLELPAARPGDGAASVACTFAAMHIEWHPLGNVSSARRAESAAARKRLTSELRRCGVSLK